MGVPTWAWVIAACAGLVGVFVAAWRQRPLRPTPAAGVPFAGAIASTVLIGEVRTAGQILTAVTIAYLLGTRGRPLDLLPAGFLVFPDAVSRQEHARHHRRADVTLRWLVGALIIGVLIWVVRLLTHG